MLGRGSSQRHSAYVVLSTRRESMAARLVLNLGAAGSSAQRLWLAIEAFTAGMEGAPAGEAVALALRALDGGRLLGELGPEMPAFYLAANTLVYGDALDAAHATFTDALAEARRRGSLRGAAMASCWPASSRSRRGEARGLRRRPADARRRRPRRAGDRQAARRRVPGRGAAGLRGPRWRAGRHRRRARLRSGARLDGLRLPALRVRARAGRAGADGRGARGPARLRAPPGRGLAGADALGVCLAVERRAAARDTGPDGRGGRARRRGATARAGVRSGATGGRRAARERRRRPRHGRRRPGDRAAAGGARRARALPGPARARARPRRPRGRSAPHRAARRRPGAAA